MEEKEVYSLFKEKGALLEGHFLLSSGLHSPIYLQCAKLLQYPEIAEKLCRDLAKKLNSKAQIVISPAIGGIIVGHEVARALKARAIFAERVEGKMTLRRGFEIKRGEKTLIVEDVITTGGSLKEIIELTKEAGAYVLGAGAIVDRSGGKVDFGVKKMAIITLNIENYQPKSCPLCRKGIPLLYLGSRHKKLE